MAGPDPLQTLERLIALAEASPAITELELQQGDLRVRVVRAVAGATTPAPATPAAAPPPPAAAAAAPAAGSPAADPPGAFRVVSPLVGTFYRGRTPGGPPLVEEGDRVEKGQTVCLIETLKLFNDIPAERAGRVHRIHLPNGARVQYGQVLFTLVPA